MITIGDDFIADDLHIRVPALKVHRRVFNAWAAIVDADGLTPETVMSYAAGMHI